MNLARALAGSIGVLRVLTLFLGVIILVLTGIWHYEDLKEQLFLAVVIITLFISIVLLIILILDKVPPTLANTLDMSYHIIGGLLLLIVSTIWAYAVFNLGDLCAFYDKAGLECQYKRYLPRIFAGVLGIINSLIFLILGVVIYRTEYI